MIKQKYYNKVLSLGQIAHKICLSLFFFVQHLYERHVFFPSLPLSRFSLSPSPCFNMSAAYLSGVSEASNCEYVYNFFSPVVPFVIITSAHYYHLYSIFKMIFEYYSENSTIHLTLWKTNKDFKFKCLPRHSHCDGKQLAHLHADTKYVQILCRVHSAWVHHLMVI